jgi:hypothetical protein
MPCSLIRLALAALAAVTLAACESATSSSVRVDITPDKTEYAAGSNVVLTVRNVGDEAVAYSFCARGLQRRTGVAWVTEDFASYPCAAILLVLEPGESVTGTINLPTDIPGGIYRVYLPGIGEPGDDVVLDGETQAEKTSRPFEVKVLVAQPA